MITNGFSIALVIVTAVSLILVGCATIHSKELITPVQQQIQQQRAIALGVKLDTHRDGRAQVSSLYPLEWRTVLTNLRDVMEKKGGGPDEKLEGIVPGAYVAWWDFILTREGTRYSVSLMVIVQAVQAKKGETVVIFTRDPLGMSFWQCDFALSLMEELQKKLQMKSLILEELDSNTKPPN